MKAELWDGGALGKVPGLSQTKCLVCGEETLYAAHCAKDGPGCMAKAAPKTCGRLKCMVATGEMEEL